MADTSFHLFPPNPYTRLTTAIAHRVWILDCRSCDAFLTNRAMKAVLLLRPNVSLFSSDAIPAGCSPYSAAPEPGRPAASHKALSSAARTCECLTQNLCCHRCGTAVGYKIVLPCTRCTSSIGPTNRATNGHRFVFHSTEVVATERHYIQHEPGVLPFDPPLFLPLPPPPPEPPVFRSDYLSTPPLQFALPAYAYDLHSSSSFYSQSEPSLYSDSPPADHKEPLHPPPSLKPGDVIFWHHLARKGEVPEVVDDPRARHPSAPDILFNR